MASLNAFEQLALQGGEVATTDNKQLPSFSSLGALESTNNAFESVEEFHSWWAGECREYMCIRSRSIQRFSGRVRVNSSTHLYPD